MDSLIVRNLGDQLVDLVRNRILSGAASPDLPIRQDALAAELGVSKIPLREALAKLEEDGLLVSRANRGFFVRPLSRPEAEEVYALRLALEPEAVALASEQASDEQRSEAVQAQALLDRLTNEHDESVGALNRAFHMSLFVPCGRPITVNILTRLNILAERYARKHLEPLGRDERANHEHREMLEAWLSGEADTAAALTKEHIEQTLDDLRRQLQDSRKNEEPA
ncbi:GntR family transcriptional regulator [Sphingosinicella sp. CPCC 101087]|uniref:GntR family transcriptional regulator n=1 Tax=Sphingosinicella sp. CPCC 101087 TaxID=2497754 RepID=UPI00101D9F14|nr:GntR family transcriptional regulator [Sphingosinicella sp. CPCC 101087]